MPEFPEPMPLWEQYFSDHVPEDEIEEIETLESTYYGELLIYVIYQEEQGTDRRDLGFDLSESSEYCTTDPADYVPDEFQADPGEIEFRNPFGLVEDDDALDGYDGWGDVPTTPTQTFATDVTTEPCSECGGTQLYCAECDDTGEIDCTESNCRGGTIEILCSACTGSGRRRKDCENCGGTGTRKERCTQCNGSGEYLNTTGSNDKIKKCRKCDRDGMMEIDCDVCSGGNAPSGQLQVTCESCGGAGATTHGQCSTCSQYPETDNGTLPCPECDSGANPPECHICNGTGEQSAVHWVQREYNIEIEWVKIKKAGKNSGAADGYCKRSLISSPDFAKQDSEYNCKPVESHKFSRADVDITEVSLDCHPDRKHIRNIRHGIRSPPDSEHAKGEPPWIFYKVSDKDRSGFNTRYGLQKYNSDEPKSFKEFVKDCDENKVSGTDDDILVPPTDPFVQVYYRLTKAPDGTLLFNLSNLHKKHPDIKQRSERIYYPTISLREGSDGKYEPYKSSILDKTKEAYESSGIIDRLSSYL